MQPSDGRPQVTVLTAGGAGNPSRTPPSHKSTPPPPAQAQNKQEFPEGVLELEPSHSHEEEDHQHDDLLLPDDPLAAGRHAPYSDQIHTNDAGGEDTPFSKPDPTAPGDHHHHLHHDHHQRNSSELLWLLICFLGIMASFVCYGLLLEYTTSGGRQLHELSFLFVTSGLYTLTAAAGRYVRDETPTTIPPARFAVLGLTSMGSTFCSVRSLRYVIYPIQVLAKSCKPVPVMLMGALMGKRYPPKKYLNVVLIVLGVALFMGGGDSSNHKKAEETDSDDGSESSTSSSSAQLVGILLLFVSLCFDGGTGAYEDKLMSVHSVQPFDLMYNIQLGKTILAGIGLLVLNELHIFLQMVQDMGFLLVALGLSGALGQVFIFVTISKFGALTCSIIGLARKVTTLVASIYFYGHALNSVQFTGLLISVGAMVLNFWGKKQKAPHTVTAVPDEEDDEELEKMLPAGVELTSSTTAGNTAMARV